MTDEHYEHSRQKHLTDTVKPQQRKARLELAVALAVIGILAGGYLTQHVFHWF